MGSELEVPIRRKPANYEYTGRVCRSSHDVRLPSSVVNHSESFQATRARIKPKQHFTKTVEQVDGLLQSMETFATDL